MNSANERVLAHLYLVKQIVNRLLKLNPAVRRLGRPDAEATGNLALCMAANSYKSGEFAAYATVAIKRRVLLAAIQANEHQTYDDMTHIPDHRQPEEPDLSVPVVLTDSERKFLERLDLRGARELATSMKRSQADIRQRHLRIVRRLKRVYREDSHGHGFAAS